MAQDCILFGGPLTAGGYGQQYIDGERLYAHRVAYERAHGPIPEGMMIDHACRVRACVNPDHLRLATPLQNMWNLGPKGGRSRFKGVSWSRRAKKWQASIKLDGRSRHLGFFVDELDAARAYNTAAAEHHGEFAYLNEVA